MTRDKVTVIDFGGQYTQLIARRARELNVYSQVKWCDRVTPEDLADSKAIILSGGPASVTADDAPKYNPDILKTGKPTLGICYGIQLQAHAFGGKVEKGVRGEYGRTRVGVSQQDPLFSGLPSEFDVWMSHFDVVKETPPGFAPSVKTENGIIAGMQSPSSGMYGVQFHPEVQHTQHGTAILKNFLYNVAGCAPSWTMANYLEDALNDIGDTVKGRDVIMFVSGGVDSTVAGTLLARAKQEGRNVGDIYMVHIDNGLMRKNESEEVVRYLKSQPGLENLIFKDFSSEFLNDLKGVVDPEKKREIIGNAFIQYGIDGIVKELKLKPDTVLCQGTLYTDLIESGYGVGNKAARIKTHHNTSAFVQEKKKAGLVVEPNREIFKDEVRAMGEVLNLPKELVWRQPFPGPGLGIRVIGGEVTPERLRKLREADAIFREEVDKLAQKPWQYFAALLCVKSVGVMGDERTHQEMCALRAVDSADGMTADWHRMPHETLDKVTRRIIGEVKGINRVLYDTGSKPPETIEFE